MLMLLELHENPGSTFVNSDLVILLGCMYVAVINRSSDYGYHVTPFLHAGTDTLLCNHRCYHRDMCGHMACNICNNTLRMGIFSISSKYHILLRKSNSQLMFVLGVNVSCF